MLSLPMTIRPPHLFVWHPSLAPTAQRVLPGLDQAQLVTAMYTLLLCWRNCSANFSLSLSTVTWAPTTLLLQLSISRPVLILCCMAQQTACQITWLRVHTNCPPQVHASYPYTPGLAGQQPDCTSVGSHAQRSCHTACARQCLLRVHASLPQNHSSCLMPSLDQWLGCRRSPE
jgi:hypothetical protein